MSAPAPPVDGGHGVVSAIGTLERHRRITGARRREVGAELRRRYERGATIRDLMALTGRSSIVVRAVLVESGVALRRPGPGRRDATGRVSGAARVRVAMNRPPTTPC